MKHLFIICIFIGFTQQGIAQNSNCVVTAENLIKLIHPNNDIIENALFPCYKKSSIDGIVVYKRDYGGTHTRFDFDRIALGNGNVLFGTTSTSTYKELKTALTNTYSFSFVNDRKDIVNEYTISNYRSPKFSMETYTRKTQDGVDEYCIFLR